MIPRFSLRSFLLVVCVSLAAQVGAVGAPEAPKGIYLLNDKQTSVDKMTLPTFLSGFSLRVAWSDLETSKGVYNFKLIETTISHLQTRNLKLTLEIFAATPPSYVMTGAKSTFMTSFGLAPVPWDSFAQARWQALLNALSAYKVYDSSVGKKVALRDHATLTAVNAPVVGLQSIRDVNGDLVKKSDYDRTKFIDSVATSIRVCKSAFPKDYLFLGFFRMTDNSGSATPLDEAVFARLQTDFMAPGKGGLGLFQETWSDVGPDPLRLGSFLVGLEAPNAVMLQALTSWKRPFTSASSVASGNPDSALDSAFVDFGCTYFELYYSDIVATDLQPVFKAWAKFLSAQ